MAEPDIRAGRLAPGEYAVNFADLDPAFGEHEARLAAERCLFCYDAPCLQACPTAIDVPLFIRQVATGNRLGAAKTILSANPLGAMCARVCPTETLCEEACVRNADAGEPVEIGRLQRFATDAVFTTNRPLFRRAAPTGRRVAVVGAGPAGLACAHRLALSGHDVTIYDARERPGGLNAFGIAAYKATADIAQREVEWLLSVGGITVQTGVALGRDVSLAALKDEFDAVFLGLGLAGVNGLGLEGEDTAGVEDAVAFIARLRDAQAAGRYDFVPVGRRVVVIGGGMTAIDAAIQARKLGAEEVTIVYRRGPEAMGASRFEQELAVTNGVVIRHFARPLRIVAEAGRLAAVEFQPTALVEERLVDAGEERFTLPADVLMKAIGQRFVAAPLEEAGLALEAGRIKVDADRRTSLERVFAGGDCVAGGSDLTVVAVEDGKIAAAAIDRLLRGEVAAAAE
jgi:dihydropyrimidine dehydrogenase (NAD+) subunit PreT